MIGAVLTGLIAALHVYIMVLEMFLWTKPQGLNAFNLTPDFAKATKALAANQGLYNGFLAAGLIWALWAGVPGEGRGIALFFLSCVFVAGVFGALTAARKILFIQALPAGLALLAVGFAL
jgi:putative membrane protein